MNYVFITKKQSTQINISRKAFFSRIITAIKQKYRISVLIGIWLLGIFFIFICIAIVLRATIYKDEQIIYTVGFNKSVKKIYDDPMLYKSIYQYFKGKNRFFQNFFGGRSIKSFLQEIYPMVQQINILDTSKPNRIDVDILFREPLFVLAYNNQRRGVWGDEQVYELQSGRLLGSESMILWMPSYITGSLSLPGIFAPLGAQKIKEYLSIIFETVPNITKVVYLIGGDRMVLILDDGKRVYINTKKDIKNQLNLFLLLQKGHLIFYSGLFYKDIIEIDVSSLEYPIVKR